MRGLFVPGLVDDAICSSADDLDKRWGALGEN